MTIPIKGPKHLTSSLITVAKEPALEKCAEYFACEPGSLPLPGWYQVQALQNHAVLAKPN